MPIKNPVNLNDTIGLKQPASYNALFLQNSVQNLFRIFYKLRSYIVPINIIKFYSTLITDLHNPTVLYR